jgi:transcription initiation factor TFIIIB Brf1 subunit/transcription initiation factor TFIIB
MFEKAEIEDVWEKFKDSQVSVSVAQKEIAEAVGTTEVTVRNRKKSSKNLACS